MDIMPIVVVGAGAAGARAAMALREQGFAGPVTLIGEEAYRPYERPPLSKAAMTDAAPPVPAFILDEARLAAAGIRHLAGARVTRIEREAHRVVLKDGSVLSYGKLLLATGARARTLAVRGAEAVLYLRTFADALALRDRLTPGRAIVVIGGGFIGLEIAASAIARGTRVTLIEMAPRLLMRGVPAEIAALVQARHASAGVDIRLGVGIDRILGTSVAMADGTRIAGDAVIAGIGAVPETGLAAESGLSLDNGIALDARLCTSDPDIYAAGDCGSFPHPLYGGRRLRLEAWRNAQDQGNFVARAMLGAAEPYGAVPWFWSDHYDVTLQIAGLPDAATRTFIRDLGAQAKLFFHLDAAGRLVGASGFGPNGMIAKDIRLAEMLIAKGARPDPAALVAPSAKLKALLMAA